MPRLQPASAITTEGDHASAERRTLPRRPKRAECPPSLLSALWSPGSLSGCVSESRSSNGATSYTLGMKFAVSIPNDLFNSVERLRRQERSSRSKLVAVALAEYVARHAGDEVTEAMNRVCEDVNTGPDDFTRTASRRVLERSEW